MSGRRSRRHAGLTLVELLVTALMMGILTSAVGYAFVAGIDQERQQARRRAQQDTTDRTQNRIARWLQGAYLSENEQDATTYFVAESLEASADLGADRLTFTSATPVQPLAAQASDDDFESQQETFGPMGGIAEVSLSTTPVGDAGNKTGLFERVQRPSDDDPTQGGRESLLGPDIDRIGFQFYDGTAWVSDWNTTSGGTRRLPAAVEVSYHRTGEPEEQVRRFIVPIPTSDVTAQNPVTTGAAP